MYYGSYIADEVKFGEDAIEFGMNPKNIEMINKKSYDELKAISSTFEETRPKEDNAFSVIIDENFYNAFISTFTAVDKMFSFRDLMSIDPRLSVFK